LEDDPEYRANVNLYREDDIIGQLEAQISNLTLDDKEKSNLKKNLESGKTIDGKEMKTAVRKTAIGKSKEYQAEK
jgi:hypothetical protein